MNFTDLLRPYSWAQLVDYSGVWIGLTDMSTENQFVWLHDYSYLTLDSSVWGIGKLYRKETITSKMHSNS